MKREENTSLEQIILLAIFHRSNRAYGSEINNEIEKKTGRKLTAGALYATLDRMVKNDLIIYSEQDDSKTRGYFSAVHRGRKPPALSVSENINILDALFA